MNDAASSVRHRFADLDTTMMEKEDGHDEFKPLSRPPLSAGRKVVVTSTSKQTESHEHDEHVNCFGNLWRMMASVILLLLLLLPFLYSFYQHTHLEHSIIPDYPSDELRCAHDYNISFARLHRQIDRATEFCGNEHHRMTCTCASPLRPIARVPGTPQYFRKWDQTHQRNRKIAAQAAPAQVILYGDSIVEHLGGTDLGDVTQEAMSVKKQFDAVFDGQAVAVGLAGDRVSRKALIHFEASFAPTRIFL